MKFWLVLYDFSRERAMSKFDDIKAFLGELRKYVLMPKGLLKHYWRLVRLFGPVLEGKNDRMYVEISDLPGITRKEVHTVCGVLGLYSKTTKRTMELEQWTEGRFPGSLECRLCGVDKWVKCQCNGCKGLFRADGWFMTISRYPLKKTGHSKRSVKKSLGKLQGLPMANAAIERAIILGEYTKIRGLIKEDEGLDLDTTKYKAYLQNPIKLNMLCTLWSVRNYLLSLGVPLPIVMIIILYVVS